MAYENDFDFKAPTLDDYLNWSKDEEPQEATQAPQAPTPAPTPQVPAQSPAQPVSVTADTQVSADPVPTTSSTNTDIAPKGEEGGTEKQDPANMFKHDFQYTNRGFSDGEALFRSVVAMGLGAIGAAAMGGDSKDVGAAATLIGLQTFGNDLNRANRFKNIAALEERGYTPETIENFVRDGNIEGLKKRDMGKWEVTSTGAAYRQDPITGKLTWDRTEEKLPVFKTTKAVEGGKVVTRQFDKNGKLLGMGEDIHKADKEPYRAPTVINKTFKDEGGVRTWTYTLSDGKIRTEQEPIKDEKVSATVLKQQSEQDAANKQTVAVGEDLQRLSDITTDKDGNRDVSVLTGSVLSDKGGRTFGSDVWLKIADFARNKGFDVPTDPNASEQARLIERVNANLGNAAVAQARAGGQVGIDRPEEKEALLKALPSIDASRFSDTFVEVENFYKRLSAGKLSKDDLDYLKSKGVTILGNVSPAPTGDSSYGSKYGF